MIFSEAYVINLKHRTDRLISITDECIKNDIKINLIAAVDGASKYATLKRKRKAVFGCYDSHLYTLKMLQHKVGEYFLVIEDDCVFVDNFRQKLEECSKQLPENWDMLYIGGSLKAKNSTENFSQNLKRAKNVLCTHAYIIKKSSITDLITTVEKRKWKVDMLYCNYQKTHNCYITVPELTWQKTGYSDLEFRVTDNLHLKNLKGKK